MYSSSLSVQIGIQTADAALFEATSRHLNTIEVVILEGALQGKRYEEMATESGYSPEYLKNNVGPKLWKLLSEALGEHISKKNLVAVLARRSAEMETLRRSGQATSVPVRSAPSVTTPGLQPEVDITLPVPSADELDSPRQLAAPSSVLYVKRPPIEERCYQELEQQPGALVRIKAPSQMGKTSLMLFCLEHARSQGLRTVALSLQRADRAALTDLDQFLRWFCATITQRLKLDYQIEDYWLEGRGSKSNCTSYFEECLLAQGDAPLLLALDQVDEIFPHLEIADEFFSLLRSWFEEAAYGTPNSALWQNLRLLIVHSTEVYIPLDTNKSPFNVGLAVELPPFTPNQVQNLAQRHNLNLSDSQLADLEHLLHGHPYLNRLALYYLARQDVTWEQLMESAATDAGIYADHLHRHMGHLQSQPELMTAYAEVVNSKTSIELEQTLAFKLNSIGLVDIEGNAVKTSCELYRQYFRDRISPSA